ncbi:MAG: dUTP diphosphatase [Defluviitaleaceae bacterium]|nr:dUTP diphosphatase [Defluviitaleaceae bacterium]
MKILIERLEHGQGLPLPSYQTAGAAGMDLYACVDDQVVLKPMGRMAVPCGFKMAIPNGYEAQIRPRSGLALKHGISMPNSPGTIDSDYRGEICVLLINLGAEDFIIKKGDRIAQMIISPVVQAQLVEVDALPDDTARGEGGFGSTGV